MNAIHRFRRLVARPSLSDLVGEAVTDSLGVEDEAAILADLWDRSRRRP